MAGKGVHGQNHGQAPTQEHQQQQSTSGRAQHTGSKPPERPLRLPPLRVELVDTRPHQKRWLRQPNLLRLQRLRRRMTTTRTFAFRERRWHQWIPVAPRQCSNLFPRALDHKVLHQFFISSGTAAGTSVATAVWRFQHHFVFACFSLAAWRVWRYECGYGRHRTPFGCTDAARRGASCSSQCVRGC